MSANNKSNLLHKLLEIASEMYRHKISTRTKAVLAHKRKLGLRTGRIPYGWQLAADGKHLEENPVEQPAFREIARSVAEYERLRDEQQAVDALLEEERKRLAATVSVETRKETRARISTLRAKRQAVTAEKKSCGEVALVARLNLNPTLYPKRTGALWVPQDIQAMRARLARIEQIETKEVQS